MIRTTEYIWALGINSHFMMTLVICKDKYLVLEILVGKPADNALFGDTLQ